MGEIKTFHDIQKLKDFMSSKPALEKMLKEINFKEENKEAPEPEKQ